MRNDHLRWTGIGCALLGAVLTALVVARWRPLLAYDERVARELHAHAVTHPGVTHLMQVLSDRVWDPWTMRALAAVACVLLWWRGDRGRALRVALVTLAAAALQQGLKALVGRERPVWPDPVDSAQYAAYPSGHAMTATVVCGLLLWLLPARPGAGCRSPWRWPPGRWPWSRCSGSASPACTSGCTGRRTCWRAGSWEWPWWLSRRPCPSANAAATRWNGEGTACLPWMIPRVTQSRRPRALSILARSQSTQE